MRAAILAGLAGAFLFPIIAIAQDVAGTWYGVLENYKITDPRRILVITQAGGQLMCTFDAVILATGSPAKCSIANGTIDLVTGAGNPVRLVISSNLLEGTLTAKGGPYRIKMERTAVVHSKLDACGQTIPYVMFTPGANVPSEFRAFSGVWIGAWAGDLCGVLIVEQVHKDGTVEVTYATGGRSPNRRRWSGTISRGKLSLRDEGRFVDYRLVNANELAGEFNSSTGSFKRR